MSEYRNYIRKDMGGGITLCEDVRLPSGSVCTVFLSSHSVYALSSSKRSASAQWLEIHELLNPIRMRLYVLEEGAGHCGLYDPLTQTLGPELDGDALTKDIDSWLCYGNPVYDAHSIESLIARIRSADIRGRGYVVDESGEIFLLRHGKLRKASPVSSDTQFFLTLFGGTLGLHRFALGKTISGIVYLLTGGLMLAGWLLDLLQLFIGMQIDNKSRYLFPLKTPGKKLLFLPIGLLFGFLPFLVYLTATDLLGLGIQDSMVRFIQNTNPEAVRKFMDSLIQFFSQFS